MKKFILIFSLMLIGGLPSLVAQTPEWLVGTWKGFGHQPNALTQSEWSMVITIKSNDSKISVDYPSIKCGGTWTLTTVEVNRCVFTENLTYGKRNCIDGGRCVLTQIDEVNIHVAFFNDAADTTKITSSSILRKEKK